jgi:hypothetical protein
MADKIFKYPLMLDDDFVEMPFGARILSVADQNGVLCLWAIVCPEAATKQYKILVRGTGHPFTGEEGRFIGTVQQAGGRLVWHVFTAKE